MTEQQPFGEGMMVDLGEMVAVEITELRRHDPQRVKHLLDLIDGERGIDAPDTLNTPDAYAAELEAGAAEKVKSLCPLPDGRRVLGGIGDTLAVWDLATGRGVRTVQNGNRLSHSEVRPSGDGRQAVIGRAGRLVALDLVTGRRRGRWKRRGWLWSPICLTPDGRHALSAHEAGKLCLWDLVTGEMTWQTTVPKLGIVDRSPSGVSVHIIPDGRHAVVAWPYGGYVPPQRKRLGVVAILDMATSEIIRDFDIDLYAWPTVRAPLSPRTGGTCWRSAT